MARAPTRRSGGEDATRLASALTDAVRRLHLDALAWAEALLPGDGVARLGGGGVEVAGVREYNPGDEIRGIDWRVTARRGRLHVKEFAPEKDQPVFLLLDRSAAVRGGRGGIREIRALEATAVLAAVAVKEGCRVGLLYSREDGVECLPAGRGRRHLPLLLSHLLEGGTGAGGGGLERLLDAAAHAIRERSRVFLLGELDLEPSRLIACRTALHDLAARHHLTAMPIRDRLEGDLPRGGSVLLRDPLTGEAAVVRVPRKAGALDAATGDGAVEGVRTPGGAGPGTRSVGGSGTTVAGQLQALGVEVRIVEVQDPLLPQLQSVLDSGGRGRRRSA